MHIEVLELAREELLYRGVLKRRGARPMPLGVGLNLREGPLDLLSGCPSMLCVLVTFFAVRAFLLSRASAGVDVCEVHGVGLGQTAEVQFNPESASGLCDIVHRLEEALTRGDPEAIRELLTPDFVGHRPFQGDEDFGPEGYIRFVAEALSLPSAAAAL